jgi:hypothetical protein
MISRMPLFAVQTYDHVPEPSGLHLHVAFTLLPVGCVPVKLVCGTYRQCESHMDFVQVDSQ